MQSTNFLPDKKLNGEDGLLVELINEQAGDDISIRFEPALFY
mgnify:FL=1